MEPFEIVLVCSAAGALAGWLWSFHKVKMMEHNVQDS